MNATFSVGYSGTLDSLKRIVDVSEKVAAVYTGGIAGKLAGGRPQYADSMDALSEQIDYAHSRGILFELTLNAPCGLRDRADKPWWRSIRNYLKDIEGIGVDSVTVSHPFLMNEVKSHTGLSLAVSTICEIMTARSALYYESLGGDVITPSMNVNMNIEALRLMRRALTRARLRIMVNEHCLGDCPWRRFHHNHYAHSSAELDYHLHCKTVYRHQPYLLLTNNVIRPEDLHHYGDVTTDFKIVGRLVPIDVLLMRVSAYTSEHFEGNYVDLCDSTLAQFVIIPNGELDGLIQKRWTCTSLCETCAHCAALFRKIGTVRRATRAHRMTG